MRAAIGKLVLAGMAATLSMAVPNQSPDERALGDRSDFIGVFDATPIGFSIDPERCPDPSHPLLLTFAGEASTTLGHATFQQSHCEAHDHTSFRRGEQTITFDDGGQLFGTYSGSILPTPTTWSDNRVIIDGLYRNAGGTGPFKSARGRGISAGVVDISTGRATVTVSGTL